MCWISFNTFVTLGFFKLNSVSFSMLIYIVGNFCNCIMASFPIKKNLVNHILNF